PPLRRPARAMRGPWLRVSLGLAWLVLVWERLLRGFWPALAGTGIGLALALSGVTSLLPGWLHLALLIALILALGVAFGLGAWRFSWPTRGQAWRALEKNARQGHRPLTASADVLALGGEDPLSRALWRRHRNRMAAEARALRPSAPTPIMAGLDPHGLRVVPILLLAVALVAGHRDPGARLLAFLSPSVLPAHAPPTATVWLTPPDYTGQPPLRLDTAIEGAATSGQAAEDGAASPLSLPAGTALLALVHGRAEAGLVIAGERQTALTRLDDQTLRAETTVDSQGRLVVRAEGRILVDRPLAVIADAAPVIAFTQPPDTGPRWRLRTRLAASDDYALTAAGLTLRPIRQQPGDPEATMDLALPLAGSDRRSAEIVAFHDLTAHRWAGRAVEITPWATDGAGQRGEGPALRVVLPRRVFSHAVAQAIIAERDRVSDSLATYGEAVTGLDGIARHPDAFGGDPAVFLALRAARAHLAGRGEASDIDRVRALLWAAALRVEEGDASRANARLDALRERIDQALSGPIDQREMDQLLRETRAALQDLMRALAQTMPSAATLPPDMMAEMESTDLDDLLARMQEMNRLGAQDALRDMLANLDQMLQSLQAGAPSAEDMAAMERMGKAADALGRMRRDQNSLLDETFRENQTRSADLAPPPRPGDQGNGLVPPFDGPTIEGGLLSLPWLRQPSIQAPSDPSLPHQIPPSEPGGPGPKVGTRGGGAASPAPPPPQAGEAVADDLARRQKALTGRMEELLAEIAEMTGTLPADLGEAALTMDDAAAALDKGALQDAMTSQRRALELLSSGRQQAMAQMRQAIGSGMPMMMPMPGGGPGRMGADPLGRGGSGSPERVGLPSRPDAQRARDILDELRRRANDPERSRPEKDYLERLIPEY
ncbi:hypothetical protein CCR92_00975, partial [Rhodospirillum rubrum]|nr:hypothetical protein [Rhodospirillum rubrum]